MCLLFVHDDAADPSPPHWKTHGNEISFLTKLLISVQSAYLVHQDDINDDSLRKSGSVDSAGGYR